ncbi:MAG: hypothetical protein A2X56_03915 [Nitrospirae bacterium GWC2_57_13]|jgi:c(7)-type cytochrome triheme protein|nr:MAG: hypothetical protein A2072_00010 [Nitrospirae bacterium GWC1_57_7]OGW27381.1 MAG: hypothetical protein A2X56_03915 [Nitrospirae bacterium GWC2_57_13]OGW43795.1 MAG: hypothetical protein A2X57_00425 [Nitrospirae bacterium GWD2_57_8]HAR45880.1 hypothetical protein [Nitrospiraceae bacterium]HAS54310.1 hypothetical protein [Nitrospiraceae bacterium]
MKRNLATGLLFLVLLPAAGGAQSIGGGDVTFKPKGAEPVVFSHELHVTSRGLKCTGCHYHVFQMTKGSYKMDMTKITKGDFCGKCHNGERSFGVLDEQNCVKCHK